MEKGWNKYLVGICGIIWQDVSTKLVCFVLPFQVSEPTVSDYLVCNTKSASVKKHGIGKGLMTVWRAINPDGGDFPTGVNFKERESAAIFQTSTFPSQKPLVQEKKKSRKLPVVVSHLICIPKLYFEMLFCCL